MTRNITVHKHITLNIVVISVIYAECCYAECHYAECRYAECRGTASLQIMFCRNGEMCSILARPELERDSGLRQLFGQNRCRVQEPML
jgi:hypothetical protein